MSYPEIYIPIDKNIHDLSAKEAKVFNEWYVRNIEERIKVLEKTVKQNEKHAFWHADYSKESLEELGDWLFYNLSARKLSEKELERSIANNNYPDWFTDIVREHSGNRKFSDETYRKCFDVGIYFGESLRKIVPFLEWTYKTSKNYIHRNQPILVKKGYKSSLNPRNIVEVVAGKFMRGEATPDKLVRTFEVWKDIFS